MASNNQSSKNETNSFEVTENSMNMNITNRSQNQPSKIGLLNSKMQEDMLGPGSLKRKIEVQPVESSKAQRPGV